jgi:hypothetical protein
MLLDLISALWHTSPEATMIALLPVAMIVIGPLISDRGGAPIRLVCVVGPMAAGALMAAAPGAVAADHTDRPASQIGHGYAAGWIAARAHFGLLDEQGWHSARCARATNSAQRCTCASENTRRSGYTAEAA